MRGGAGSTRDISLTADRVLGTGCSALSRRSDKSSSGTLDELDPGRAAAPRVSGGVYDAEALTYCICGQAGRALRKTPRVSTCIWFVEILYYVVSGVSERKGHFWILAKICVPCVPLT